jgi:hypothetical protein
MTLAQCASKVRACENSLKYVFGKLQENWRSLHLTCAATSCSSSLPRRRQSYREALLPVSGVPRWCSAKSTCWLQRAINLAFQQARSRLASSGAQRTSALGRELNIGGSGRREDLSQSAVKLSLAAVDRGGVVTDLREQQRRHILACIFRGREVLFRDQQGFLLYLDRTSRSGPTEERGP